MAHVSLTVDVTTLYKAMVNLSASQDTMLEAQAAMSEAQAAALEEVHQKLSDVTNLLLNNNMPLPNLGTLALPLHMNGEYMTSHTILSND